MSKAPASIHDLLVARASLSPTSVALEAPGRDPLTYARLVEHVHEMVRALEDAGIGAGQRVAVVLPNGPEMAATFLAVAATATCAPLNPVFCADEFDRYLLDLKPHALIVQAGLASAAETVARVLEIPVIRLIPQIEREAGIFSLSASAPAARSHSIGTDRGDLALLLHTSGTTSRPKMVPLTQSNLCHSAVNIGASLGLTSQDCCLNVMPLFHIHGLIGALLASIGAGAATVCAPGFSAQEFFDWFDAFRPTWYTAVPPIHRAILAIAAQRRPEMARSRLRFIRSCSAALPPQLMGELEALFSVPVVEAYGMTEASHQITINPLPPGQRKPGSVGLPTGPHLAVIDQPGRPLGPNRVGAILVSGETVTPGYLGVTGGGYVEGPSEADAPSAGKWFDTGDQGYLDADGYLFITGRIKEMINRGGQKISPREVEEVLLDYAAVADAVAFAIPDARLGEDVGAAVVLRSGAAASESELRAFAAQRLSYYKLPRRVLFLPELPKGATGKLQRAGMAEKLGLAATTQSPGAAGASDPRLNAALIGIWRRILRCEHISLDADFFDLGGDSLSALQVVLDLENLMNVRLSPDALFAAPTIERLADLIKGRSAALRPSVVGIQPSGSRPPFFCMYAGPLFRQLATCLGDDQPFLSVCLPRLDELPPLPSLEDIARQHVEALLAYCPDGPFFIGGWCTAGVVAYEVAQQLRARARPAALLVLFDAINPDLVKNTTKRAELFARLRSHMCELRGLKSVQMPAYVRQHLQAVGGRLKRRAWRTGVRMRSNSRTIWRDTEEVVYRAADNYHPQPYDRSVLLFRQGDRRTGHHSDPRLGWGEQLVTDLQVFDVDGDHREMFAMPFVQKTADRLGLLFEARTPHQPDGARNPAPAPLSNGVMRVA